MNIICTWKTHWLIDSSSPDIKYTLVPPKSMVMYYSQKCYCLKGTVSWWLIALIESVYRFCKQAATSLLCNWIHLYMFTTLGHEMNTKHTKLTNKDQKHDRTQCYLTTKSFIPSPKCVITLITCATNSIGRARTLASDHITNFIISLTTAFWRR